MTKDKKVK